MDPSATQREPAASSGRSARSAPADIHAELRAAGFEDPREIGRGGFGVVFRCAQPALDRTIAIKVLNADLDDENLERFLREQRAMGRLSGHPHIVTVMQAGTTPSGRPYIVMQYHPKDSLDALIRRHGPLDWIATLSVGVKLAGALEAAHRSGTLHRDVKPGNILLTDYGEPQLTDFGIARIAGGFETGTGVFVGSPAYTAPEVLNGRGPTPVSDVYSLGATLFCALTGHVAFERRSGEQVLAQFLRISSEPIPDLREQGVPDDVSAMIERAMAIDPGARPQSAAAFGDELREIQRRNNVPVDEMARPTDLAAERRKPAGAPRHTTSADTPPTPATKYRPPTSTRALVARERLLDTLQSGERRRLVLIHAPSGFGKSTLAAQWRDVLTAEGVAVAWLSIDDDDNNVVWFLAHLLEAIRRVRPALAEQLGRVLEEHGDNADRFVLTLLIDEIHERGDRVAVVIDDWHRVTDPKTTAALTFLLDKGCHHLQIVVTSWSRAGLPLSKMRIRDELVEIDATTLRFDAGEAQSFLVDVGGLRLPQDDIDALTRTTDGWVAALQLATLSLRGGEDPGELLSRLSGRNEVIGEFLAENVLDTLDSETLDFLLTTSITDRVCGPLAGVLAGVDRGQARLEQIEQRGLFLARIDHDREWFAYHHMFAEYLRRRLERDRPDDVARLHRVASAWFADRHLLNEAVEHALAAGDPSGAVDLVERDDTQLTEHAKMSSFLGIVTKLPPQLTHARPRLQLTVAWANMLLQQSAPTIAALNRLEHALQRSSLPATEQRDLRAEADVVRALADALSDRVGTVDALVAPAISQPNTLTPRASAVAGNVWALASIFRFDHAEVGERLRWAQPYNDMLGPFGAVYGVCYNGIAAHFALEIDTAVAEFRRAYDMVASIGPLSHAVRFAGALLGEVLYETGAVEEATELLDSGYELGTDGGGSDYLIARFVGGARIAADRDTAVQRLAEGMKVAENIGLARLAARITNQRVRLGVDLDPAVRARIIAPRDLDLDDGIARLTAEHDEDSAIRLTRDVPRAQRLVASIDAARRPLHALRAKVLLAELLPDDAIAAECVAAGVVPAHL